MGRRLTVIIGSLGLAFSMLIIATLLRYNTSETSIAAFFFIYMSFFGATMNCVPWVYVPEILPLLFRVQGASIGTSSSSNWLWNFVIVMITPVSTANIDWRTYILLTCTNFTAAILIYFFYLETVGKSLEEIDSMFLGKYNWRKAGV